MRFLVLLLFVAAAPAWAGCRVDDVVTSGATLSARSSDGRPLITIEGVGDVSVVHHGDGSGGFTLVRECDPAYAAKLRARLERLLARERLVVR